MQVRFIPMNVGNIEPQPETPANYPVHPHECGEHSPRMCMLMTRGGSSPRMWGTFCRRHASEPAYRFIPTNVGNILSLTASIGIPSVHPHECGEHVSHVNQFVNYIGSSPRMWGTCAILIRDFFFLRFIPTNVGNMTMIEVVI